MPPRASSRAAVKGLATVAKAMAKEDLAALRAKVVAHMDEHPEDVRQLAQLCETGYISKLTADMGGRQPIPSSTTKLRNVSKTLQFSFLTKAIPGLNRATMRLLEGADKNIRRKLFLFCLCDSGDHPVSASWEDEFIDEMIERQKLLSVTLQGLPVDANHVVDWQSIGFYQLVPDEGKKHWTHIRHCVSDLQVALDTPLPCDLWKIESNWDEQHAELFDQKRTKVACHSYFPECTFNHTEKLLAAKAKLAAAAVVGSGSTPQQAATGTCSSPASTGKSPSEPAAKRPRLDLRSGQVVESPARPAPPAGEGHDDFSP